MDAASHTLVCPSLAEINEADRNWKWFLALGIFSIVLGSFALAFVAIATVASIFFLGFLLLAIGFVEGIHAFKARKTEEGNPFFFRLLAAVLYAVVGALFIVNPIASAASLALLLGAFFVAGGVFRIIGASVLHFRNWGWVVFNGVVTLMLGVIVLTSWPVSGLWVIGLLVGVEMVINGWSWALFAWAARDDVRQTRVRCAF
jgi:uncharacterized membrane protein HdeD (DUF308 family)